MRDGEFVSGQSRPQCGAAFEIAPHVRSVTHPACVVVLDGRSERFYRLEGVACEVWRLLNAGATLPEIESALCDEYAEPAARIRTDVREFIGELRARELVR